MNNKKRLEGFSKEQPYNSPENKAIKNHYKNFFLSYDKSLAF